MSITYHNRSEIEQNYESARAVDGPWSSGKKMLLERREAFHLVDVMGQKFLDLHGQILCDSLGTINVMDSVRRQLEGVNMSTFGPEFTHPVLDMAQNNIAEAFRKAGWGEYSVMFNSSGTRANENALRLGRAVLGGRMHLTLLKEGYHGAGLMSATCGHSTWKAQSTFPLGVPTTFLDYRDGDTGRDFEESYDRMLETDAAKDALPYLMAEGGVQGVAGFELIDAEALKRMAIKTNKLKGIVHYDLVQTMPWRTSDNLFSLDGLVDPKDQRTIPDLITSAKGNGGGIPFAFLAIKKDRINTKTEGLGKGYDTFGRTLEGAAAFNTVFTEVNKPAFQENVRQRSQQLEEGLMGLKERYGDKIKKITGKGLMRGVKLPSPESVAAFKRIGLEKTGLVIAAGGTNGNFVRIGNRLDAPANIIAEALQRIEDTLKELRNTL
jgi:4-aminobutyrate aminotransferase-like enzyme